MYVQQDRKLMPINSCKEPSRIDDSSLDRLSLDDNGHLLERTWRNEQSSKMTGTSIISSLADNICVYGTITWPMLIGGAHTDDSIQRAYRRYVDMVNANFAHVMTLEEYERYWQ